MKQLKIYLTIFIFMINILPNVLSAQNIRVYATPIEKTVQGKNLDKQSFEIITDGVVNYDNGTWTAVKLEIPSHLAKADHFIHLSYALLDTVELWNYDKQKNLVRKLQTGQAFPFDTRPYESPDFVFPITEGTKDYFFRIYSSKPVVLPFEVLSENNLFANLTTKDFLFGSYTGIILVMFLYNFVLIFITRDRSYAYYVSYLLVLVITQLALFGYTDRFLLGDWPALNQKFAVISGALVAIVSVFFIINFLQLKQKSPLFTKLFYSIIVSDTLGLIFLTLDWNVLAFHWVNVTSLYGSILGIIISIKLSMQGFKPAKFFFVAWSLFLASVIIFALVNLGIIPYTPYLHGAMLFGSSIEAVLLSVALADRINVLREEKERSQAKALEMARVNEEMISKQNSFLEEQVQNRTEALQSANKELTATLENLKSTQAQLVQSEKMASLGILTAGVAHEINNPLNYIHGGYTAITNKIEKKKTNINKEDLQTYLKWIHAGVERATKIVRNLNLYSRSSENYTEDCSLHEHIDHSLHALENRITGNITIIKELESDADIVKGNNTKIGQVILGILENAIDAISTKGQIIIRTESKHDNSILTIDDNGCGISKENIKKVMDPFFTTKSPGKGTGLGLSIVQSIIHEHGGNVYIESTLGKRTLVTVRLPKS